MEYIKFFVDLFLNLDEHMANLITQYGVWTYAILFLVIFMETAFVVTPLLPGDSLLFAAGMFAAIGSLDIYILLGLLIFAAILGDTVNYSIGRYLGERAYNIKWIKQEYFEKTHAFYEKHGGKTIVLARFVPIVRTFAPFVAGIGKMSYKRFLAYNIIGGIAWVLICTLAGFFFGNIPVVRENFEIVIIGIILLSIMPIGIEWWKARRAAKAALIEACARD
jgi:membrane-associated protein